MAFNHKHLIDITEYSADDIMTHPRDGHHVQGGQRAHASRSCPTLQGLHRRQHVQRAVHPHALAPSRSPRSACPADSLNFGGSSTSSVKGESLDDTVETLSSYKIDMVIVRDKRAGVPCKIAARRRTRTSSTRATASISTRRRRCSTCTPSGSTRGTSTSCTWASSATSAHSRVCGSLIPALKIMGAEVTVIAPPTLMPARPDILGADHVCHNIDECLAELDVVYMLRIQRERLEGAPYPSLREYNRAVRPHAGARAPHEARRHRRATPARSTAASSSTTTWPTTLSARSSLTRSTRAS